VTAVDVGVGIAVFWIEAFWVAEFCPKPPLGFDLEHPATPKESIRISKAAPGMNAALPLGVRRVAALSIDIEFELLKSFMLVHLRCLRRHPEGLHIDRQSQRH
jgi:hypothetical protein